MKPGIYVYSRADLYYKENSGPAPVGIQVVDAVTGGVSVKESVICMKNVRSNMNGLNADTYGITDIEVCPDYTQVITTRHFLFNVSNQTINFTVPVIPVSEKQTKVGDVNTTYASIPSSDKINMVLLVQNLNSSNDFEVRSWVHRLDADYYLAIHMTYTACDPILGCQVTNCPKLSSASAK